MLYEVLISEFWISLKMKIYYLKSRDKNQGDLGGFNKLKLVLFGNVCIWHILFLILVRWGCSSIERNKDSGQQFENLLGAVQLKAV